MSETQKQVLLRNEQTDQTVRAIAMLNRLSVAQIRLKRADRFGDGLGSEIKEIRDTIHSLTDSVLLGEDVRSNLSIIDERITQFEQRIAIH